MSERTRTRLLALLLLFALPLALRLFALEHGGERGYVPDAHAVRAALGMLRDKDLAPPVGKYSVYPNLLPYLLLPVFAAQFAFGKLAGAWGSAQEFGEHVLAHPQHAAWAARALVAVFGALTVWVVFRAARAVGLRSGAWIAAWLVATGLLHVQLSTHERPWVPMTFFIAACAWAAIVHQRGGSLRALVASGACAGLALATHQGGAPALLITGLAWFLAPRDWRSRQPMRLSTSSKVRAVISGLVLLFLIYASATGGTKFWHWLVWGLLGLPNIWLVLNENLRARFTSGTLAVFAWVVVALLLGYPARLVHGETPVEQIIGGARVDELGGFSVGGVSIIPEMRWSSFTRLAKAFVGYDPVVLGFGLLGLVLAWRLRLLRPPLVFTVLWLAVFMTNRSDHVRYLLPAAVMLALFAGVFAEAALRRPWGRWIVLPCLALPLVQALRFDWILARDDTRALAEERLAALPRAGVVAIDRYGPEVDLDRPSLIRLDRLRRSRGDTLRPREENRLRALERGEIPPSGVNAVRVEELFEIDVSTNAVSTRAGLEGLGATSRDVLRALGVTHALLVDRRPRARTSSLIVDASARGPLIWGVDPASDPDELATEAFLPSEMDFPLIGLWMVLRPGPLLELVELR